MKHLTYLIYIILFETLVLVGPAYVVFWKGNSEVWMLLCILSLFAYSPMKWISDNDSVDTEAFKHKQTDAYLVYDDAIRTDPYSKESKAAYAEHEALFAAHLDRADISDQWVDNYFDVTGENKLDYIDVLDKEGE